MWFASGELEMRTSVCGALGKLNEPRQYSEAAISALLSLCREEMRSYLRVFTYSRHHSHHRAPMAITNCKHQVWCGSWGVEENELGCGEVRALSDDLIITPGRTSGASADIGGQ